MSTPAAAPTYAPHGPVRSQDGRAVYTVVRLLPRCDGSPQRGLAVAECLTLAQATRHATALNTGSATA